MSVNSVLKTCILLYYRLVVATDGEIMLCNISLLLSCSIVFNVHAQRPTDCNANNSESAYKCMEAKDYFRLEYRSKSYHKAWGKLEDFLLCHLMHVAQSFL